MSPILMVLSVFTITTSTTADYKVFVTNKRHEAHLLVWQSKSKWESLGKEEIWFKSKSRSESSFTIRWVKSRHQSDLIIFFVKNRSEAGWQGEHRLKGNLFQYR